uniref:TIL domain-containing protein n=1 Tax=Panagrolaimus sp. PS1159 TaxID=55785 RepID=A0AC35F6D9_9BILA
MKTFFIFFVAFVLIETVFGRDIRSMRGTCSENEDFVECSSKSRNHCEPSCENPNPQYCTLMCADGCDCKEGFVRSPQGKCIKLSEC